MDEQMTADAAIEALRLQMEWGVDEALLEAPLDRFAAAVPARSAPSPVASIQARPAVAPTRTPVVPDGASAAAGAVDLAGLLAALDALDCPLRRTASSTVAPSGDPSAGLVMVGEAPGPDDDRSGQAYSGAPGAVLDRVLGSAGLGRGAALLTFLVPWRPPGGRPSSEVEVALCVPFLLRLLAITRPRLVVLMGGWPLRALAGDAGGIRRARGKWTSVAVPGGEPIPALPMLPPELWLSSATARQSTWTDLLALRTVLAGAPGTS